MQTTNSNFYNSSTIIAFYSGVYLAKTVTFNKIFLNNFSVEVSGSTLFYIFSTSEGLFVNKLLSMTYRYTYAKKGPVQANSYKSAFSK